MIKLEHMILHLKSITLQNNSTLKHLNLHKNNLCLLNLKTPITRINLRMKNIIHTVTGQIIPSLLVSKNKEMMKKNETLMHDQNHSYNTFVLLLTTEQNSMITDIEVEVLPVTTLTTKRIHKKDIVLPQEIDLVMIKTLLLHNTLDHDMIHTNAIHVPILHHTDLLIDHLMDIILAHDIDHALFQETEILPNAHLHTDHLPDQEILDFLDLARFPILEIKSK